ncbi:aconitate hydratase [Pisolithus albus]|nr:aconitate hydratase [Pisolithus albus]
MSIALRKGVVVRRAVQRCLATHAPVEKDCTSITPPYGKLQGKLELVREILNHRPLTLAEKILYSHLVDPVKSLAGRGKVRGEAYLQLNPQRVAMQDASAHLQFMSAGLPRCAVPTSIHCDHLIQAADGAASDLERSIISNQEVFDFLESAARKYGIEFWKPDSHTPNAGGLGLLAIGVGGADAVDAMTGTPWELKAPQLWLDDRYTSDWETRRLDYSKGHNSVLDREAHRSGWHWSHPGILRSRVFIPNLAPVGDTFPGLYDVDEHYFKDLQLSRIWELKGPVARAADEAASRGYLSADEGCEYDEVIEINLSKLEPMINGPFTPDLATPLSKFGTFVQEQGWKDEVTACLIGSCTNSSYEDMTRVAEIAEQAKAAGLKTRVPFLCTPGSEQIRATMERDGVTTSLQDCRRYGFGECLRSMYRSDAKGKENAILTSFNRNFKSRNDGNRYTMNFLASPTIVTAMAFSGKLSFDPTTDSITLPNGKPFKFSSPKGQDLPSNGFTLGNHSYYPSPMPKPEPETEVIVKKASQRLELLEPFPSHFGPHNPRGLELPALKVLMRVRGKCTTDHISAAGPWLKYKGHLTNISENTLITAVNDEGGETNVAFDHDHGVTETACDTIPTIAKRFKSRNQPWALIADENYGEGSAREHAALQPRFYGCAMIVARSFARIHETNLKKQGVLPLWFADAADYSRVGSGDTVETVSVAALLGGDPNAAIKLRVLKRSGEVIEMPVKHTMSADQVNWFRAGSALNYIRSLT